MGTEAFHGDGGFPWGRGLSTGTGAFHGDGGFPRGRRLSMGTGAFHGDGGFPRGRGAFTQEKAHTITMCLGGQILNFY